MWVWDLGLLAAGVLMKATSHADVRQWEMLPRTVFLIPLQVPPGTHEISVAFRDGSRQTWRNIPVAQEGESTFYIHMEPWAHCAADVATHWIERAE